VQANYKETQVRHLRGRPGRNPGRIAAYAADVVFSSNIASALQGRSPSISEFRGGLSWTRGRVGVDSLTLALASALFTELWIKGNAWTS
jgi:hypothetical protein